MRKILLLILYILLFAAAPSSAANKKFTLVIDAGHGGKDPGCRGSYSKEKDLTLKAALALGRLIEDKCPDVKVVYTRKSDVYLELSKRAEIANRNKADLFISIHINAVPGGKIVRGYQTWTLGRGETTGKKGIMENLDVAKRENSVIFLEKDYKQTYKGFDPNSPESNIMFEFLQDHNMEKSVELAKYLQSTVCAATGRQNQGAHQNNLAVLRLTSMPGCLCELGFISTPDEENFMNSAEAPSLYARGIYQAIMKYRAKYDPNITVPFEPTVVPEPSIPSAVPGRGDITVPEKQEVVPEKQEVVPEKQEVVPEPQPVVTPEQQPVVAETPSTPEPQPEENAAEKVPEIVFKVQILASDSELKAGSPQFKGEKEIDSYREGGMVKYTIGSSPEYVEINKLKKSLAEKFPQAYVVAFRGGQKISVADALKEQKAGKR